MCPDQAASLSGHRPGFTCSPGPGVPGARCTGSGVRMKGAALETIRMSFCIADPILTFFSSCLSSILEALLARGGSAVSQPPSVSLDPVTIECSSPACPLPPVAGWLGTPFLLPWGHLLMFLHLLPQSLFVLQTSKTPSCTCHSLSLKSKKNMKFLISRKRKLKKNFLSLDFISSRKQLLRELSSRLSWSLPPFGCCE